MTEALSSKYKRIPKEGLLDTLAVLLLLVLFLGAADTARVRRYEDPLSGNRHGTAISVSSNTDIISSARRAGKKSGQSSQDKTKLSHLTDFLSTNLSLFDIQSIRRMESGRDNKAYTSGQDNGGEFLRAPPIR